MRNVLIVEDDRDFGEALGSAIRRTGRQVVVVGSGESAVQELSANVWDAVLVDLGLPDMDGLELIAQMRASDPRVPIIVLTGRDEARAAVAALRHGANDYLTKPFEKEELLSRLELLTRQADLIRELDASAGAEGGTAPVGQSAPFVRALDRARAAARSPSTSVLIAGESGVGKEVLARWMHRCSPRASGPFVAMNSACLSPNLVESELFGHEAGAFTGATTRHRGLFEVAQGGTLFLDEIGELPLTLQPKLLRVLEERAFRRVGGSQEIRVDVRLLTATNRDLLQAVDLKTFRVDLYHRLRVFEVAIPPLRERGDDVLLLAESFARQLSTALGRQARWHPDAYDRLRGHQWPGNVRELRNATEHALLVSSGEWLMAHDLPADVSDINAVPASSRRLVDPLESLDTVIERHVRAVYAATGGNVSRTAAILGIGRVAVRRRLSGVADPAPPKGEP